MHSLDEQLGWAAVGIDEEGGENGAHDADVSEGNLAI